MCMEMFDDEEAINYFKESAVRSILEDLGHSDEKIQGLIDRGILDLLPSNEDISESDITEAMKNLS